MTIRRATARPATPLAFGHRGALGHGLENTIEAFRLGLELGATGLESDAWLAADGAPVLVHDRTIRPAGRRIDVTRRPAAELRPWGVPTLAELYEACGTAFELSLDVKQPEVVGPLLVVARTAGAIDRLWLCHEEVELLAATRRRDREVRLVHSIEPRGIHGPFEGHLERLADAGIGVLNMRWRGWSADRVAAAHRSGIMAFGWDVLEPADIERALDFGLDAVYCDYPERIVRAIAARQPVAAAADGPDDPDAG
jgi:glycerophosphoryl diester phosphodiesterase